MFKSHDYKRTMRLRHDKAFGKLVDRPSIGTKRKAPNARMDTSAVCPHCNGAGKSLLGVKCEFGNCLTCDGIGRKAGKLCLACSGYGEVTTCKGTGRVVLDALGMVKHVTGKANGSVATPSTYTAWLKAGRPAHPIYNPDACYDTHGILKPTGKPAERVTARHTPDCDCRICQEFKGRSTSLSQLTTGYRMKRIQPVQGTTPGLMALNAMLTTAVDTTAIVPVPVPFEAQVLSPVPYGPWPRPNGLRPPLGGSYARA